MRGCAIYVMLATACARADGLPALSELEFNGDARLLKNAVRITRAKNDKAGAVWLRGKQAVRSGFDTRFTFQFTEQGGLGKGADGLAFVIQNSAPGALGGLGGSGGF